MMKRSTGFTLIEMMVVVAIIAILTSIAVPSYTRYVQRGDLVEGTQTLAQFRVQMEQWFQDNNTYANGGVCGVVPPATPPLVNFRVTCALVAGGQGYTATATGINQIAGFVYTVDQSNNQQTTGLPTGWSPSTTLPATSWIIR